MDKGLAADSEKEALYVHIRPPGAGQRRSATRLASPASRRRLGRLLAWGMLPPAPWAAPPCALTRTGTRYLPTKRERVPWAVLDGNFQKAPQARATGGWANRRFVHAEGVSLSPDNSRTRRAVHTLVVWAGELSRRGKGRAYAPLSTAFEEINRLVRYRVLAPRVVTQNCAA